MVIAWKVKIILAQKNLSSEVIVMLISYIPISAAQNHLLELQNFGKLLPAVVFVLSPPPKNSSEIQNRKWQLQGKMVAPLCSLNISFPTVGVQTP